MRHRTWWVVILGAAVLVSLALYLVPILQGMDDKGFRVGISNGFVGNNWRNQMLESLNTAITTYEAQGLIQEVIIKNAGEDVNNQILQIKHLIANRVDLLLIDPNSRDGLNDVIREARSKGILVVVFDQNVSSTDAVQLTVNQKEWGAMLGTWLGETLTGRGNVLLMSGVKNQPCNNDRVEGIRRSLANYPAITILEEVFGNWDQATAKKQMTEALYRHPHIDGILSQDGMALGVLQAYEAADRSPPVMTGETMNAFLEKSIEMSSKSDFQTYALTNPPGIGASALSLGLLLMTRDWLPDTGGSAIQLFYPVREIHIHKGMADTDGPMTKGLGTQYMDEWMNMTEIEAQFFPSGFHGVEGAGT